MNISTEELKKIVERLDNLEHVDFTDYEIKAISNFLEQDSFTIKQAQYILQLEQKYL